jgi:hypothetical protein
MRDGFARDGGGLVVFKAALLLLRSGRHQCRPLGHCIVKGARIFAKYSRAEIIGAAARGLNIRGSNIPECEFRHSPPPDHDPWFSAADTGI